MEVIVRCPGCDDVVVEVHADDLVKDVAGRAAEQLGLNSPSYVLLLGEDTLARESPISDAGVTSGVTLDLLVAQYTSDEMLKAFQDLRDASEGSWQALLERYPGIHMSEEFVLQCVKSDGNHLRYVHPILQANCDVVIAAVSTKPHTLQYASDFLRSQRNVVREAVDRDVDALKHSLMCDDRPMVLHAVRLALGGRALKHASERLQDDKQVVMEAVRTDGYAYLHASPRLREDREVVLVAVSASGNVVRYATDFLNDEEVVMRAVRQNGGALRYTPNFQSNRGVVLAAGRCSSGAVRHADPSLFSDLEIARIAVKIGYTAQVPFMTRLKCFLF